MPSNYKKLGYYIKPVKHRNTESLYSELLGINIDKFFMPSVANIVGVDLSKYKVVSKGQFACNRMHVGRDYRIPIALSHVDTPFLVSPAYDVFEIKKPQDLNAEYLMMWFSRPEFDRNAWFHTDGDVRGGLPWDAFCNLELPVPHIDVQRTMVKEYNTITDRIALTEQLNRKLEETAQALFNKYFDENNYELNEIRLGNLIEIKGGYSYHSSELGTGKTYLLGMGCISFSDRFVEDGMRLYSDEFPEKHLVRAKDIVIATRQQSENMPILGYPAMIPPDLEEEHLLAASNLYRVVNNSEVGNEVLYQLLRSDGYLERIRLNTKGTTVGMITKDAIEDYCFLCPSKTIVVKLQRELESIVDLIFLNRKEIKALQVLRGLLLSKMSKVEMVVAGGVVVD